MKIMNSMDDERLIAADTALEIMKLHRMEVNDLEDQLELVVRRCQLLEDQVQGLIVERDELMEMITAGSGNDSDRGTADVFSGDSDFLGNFDVQ